MSSPVIRRNLEEIFAGTTMLSLLSPAEMASTAYTQISHIAKPSPLSASQPPSMEASPRMSLNFDSPAPALPSKASFTFLDDSSRDSGVCDLSFSSSSVCSSSSSSSPGFSTDVAGFSQLLHAPLLTPPSSASSPALLRRTARRGLFRSSSAPLPAACEKRASPDSGIISRPVKRLRCARPTVDQENSQTPIKRCQSEVVIKSAMSRADSHSAPLIGDCSQEYCLPLCPSKHQDLKGISPDTVSSLLDGQYNDVVNKFLIVDCRYPYEYEGGHIQGAENLYTKTDIYNKFLHGDEYRPSSSDKRNILIFHCEFSSERGPKMSRFLRNKDRDANKECYPSLHYPEVYLLEGGYKNFWEQHSSKCTKNGAYKPMLDKAHSQDLKTFRAKSKTWAGEKSSSRSRTTLRF